MKPSFTFLEAASLLTLVDHELELVEPQDQFVNDLLAGCHHPQTKQEMPAQARTTHESLTLFISQNQRGRTTPDSSRNIAPGYTFWMRLRADAQGNGQSLPAIPIAGSISLRIGHSQNLDYYLGHIGYHVLPPARGHHYAERACRLLLPLARMHGHKMLWITCNPENTASRITCQRLGAIYVDTVAVPRDNPLHSQGDREKCRYRLDL